MKMRVPVIITTAVIASNVIPAAAQTANDAKITNVKVTNFPKTTQTTQAATKWQYKCVTLKKLINAASERDLLSSEEVLKAKIEKALNVLGNQGWELIHVSDQAYIFKRPRD